MTVSGWPGRAGRSAYGLTMRDERLTADTEREFNAAQANLTFWQLGAMGLAAPKAVIQYKPTTSEPPGTFLYGAFSWDQTIYVGGSPPSYLTITDISQTNIEFAFDNTVLGRPDEDGVPQSEVLDFQFGFADMNVDIATTERWFAEFELTDPQTFHVRTYRGAVTDDAPFIVVVW